MGINVFIFCLILEAAVVSAYPNLQQVNILLRHGDRSPVDPFPNDPWAAHWENYGLGQLTELGMRQAFELGQFFRHQYGGLVNETYHQKEVYIRSTDSDRTLMSAYTALTGLYSPKGFQVWHPDIPWQPIPVHTVDVNDDYLLQMDIPKCPRYDELWAETVRSPEWQQKNASFESLYQYLKDNAGLDTSLSMDPFLAWAVYDTLHVEKNHNMTIPTWATDDIYLPLKDDLMPWFFASQFTGEKVKFKPGPLMGEIVSNMENCINSTDGEIPKMYLYSAHDDNIVNQLVLLDVFDNVMPNYCASILYELYEIGPGTFGILVYYRNDTSSDKQEALLVPGCPSQMCPLETFVSVTRQQTPIDWHQECQATSSAIIKMQVLSTNPEVRSPTALAIILGALGLGVVTTIIVIIYTRTRKETKVDDEEEVVFMNEERPLVVKEN